MKRILLVCALLWPALAKGQTAFKGTHVTGSDGRRADPGSIELAPIPELQHRPRSAFENSLMSELACTCGDCKLELINSCRCDFAAKMRGEVLAELDGLDLATEAARSSAAEAVRASLVARYGPNVLDRMNSLDPKGRIAAFVLATIALTFVAAILLRRRSIRLRTRQGR